MSPPDPLPGPIPSRFRDSVGTNCGTSTASTSAEPASADADVRSAVVLIDTVEPVAPVSPMPRPHRVVCSRCWRNSISKNPAAVSAKLHHGTPPEIMLTGML